MAFEIVDGMTGTKHISSDDLAALNTATVGKANCVLEYGNDFALTMTSANAATLGTGVGMVGGKRFWNQAATSLTIQSGTQGQKRNDLVVARYAKTSAGIESINPVVINGTPTAGNPTDPNTTANDLKLWRIPLDGINAGTPVRLFKPVTPLATLGDSASHAPHGVVKREVVSVPGFVGGLTVEYCLVGGATSYDPERALWLRLSGYSYVNNQSASDGPWGLAVKAPSGSTRWCVRIPFKATTGKAGDWSIDTYVMMLGADTGYYLTYGASTSKRLFSASDGYLYLDMYEDRPSATPIGMWFNATLPVARP